MELSKRLAAVAGMVTKGNVVCDAGCDHGYVSVFLIMEKISPKVIAMDIRIGPLSRANEHIRMYGLSDYIETRLSDGVEKLEAGEADTLILAGMGGRLMESILTRGREKVLPMKEIILQPQSEIPQFRKFLRKEGFLTCQENMVFEDGKYYPMMRVLPGKGGMEAENADNTDVELADRYGGLLLSGRHPVLQQYLQSQREKLLCLQEELCRIAATSEKSKKRAKEIERELLINQKASVYFDQGK